MVQVLVEGEGGGGEEHPQGAEKQIKLLHKLYLGACLDGPWPAGRDVSLTHNTGLASQLAHKNMHTHTHARTHTHTHIHTHTHTHTHNIRISETD